MKPWPKSERIYGSEVGCDLPPEMRDDGDLWPCCIRCRFMFTRNFSGLCVRCRYRMADFMVYPDTKLVQDQKT